MPTYTVKAPNGSTFKLNGSGGPPTEQELEQVYMKIAPAESSITPIKNELGVNESQQSTANAQSLSNTPEQNTQAVEQQIAQRPTAFGKNAQYDMKNHPILSILKGLSAPFQAAEAVPADIGLALQRAQTGGLQALPGNLSQDIQGNRVPQMGDIYRGAGVPEPIAATMGLISATAPEIPNLWAKGASPLVMEGAKLGFPESQAAVKQLAGASKGIPNPAALGTNLVAQGYGKAVSPVASFISAAAEKFGKPFVAKLLETTTTRPSETWSNLIDNPEWGNKNYVAGLKKEASAAYAKNVVPLAEDTTNRVPLSEKLKNSLIDMGIFVKPQGVDNSTFMQAVNGDRVSVQELENKLVMDKMANLGLDQNMTAAQRGKAIQEIYKNKAKLTPLEPSQGMGGMTESQRGQITKWFKRIMGSEDMSFNQIVDMQKEMGASQKSYYKLAKAEGTGITGAQANSFNHYVGAMQNALSENLAQLPQYQNATKAIKLYARAANAQETLRQVSGIDPHMFRAIFTRMGLESMHVPGAGLIGAGLSVPSVSRSVIRSSSKLGGVMTKNPASILAPLLRASGVSQQNDGTQ